MFFFLARRVVSRTSGDEFHSLNATAISWDRSHWDSSANWVDFPDPSIPSTTISLPLERLGTSSGIRQGRPSPIILWDSAPYGRGSVSADSEPRPQEAVPGLSHRVVS